MISNSLPSSYANTVAPYAPLGRAAVGQEDTELKSSSFKPTEQLAESVHSQNRRLPDERPNDEVEQDRQAALSQERRANSGRTEEELKTEQKQIQDLAARDREVRAHEQAHAAVAGQYAGSPTYSFVRGPDGVSYAVGGSVEVDTSPIPGDPEATLRKAQQLRRAANAPAEPSSQDGRVAAQAAKMELEARAELRAKEAAEAEEQNSLRGDDVKKEDESQAAGSAGDAELARREREEERIAQDENRLQREQLEFEEEQRLLDQRQARAELFNESTRRNIDINRRLIEIGVFADNNAVGSFLNKTV
ncbi:catalase [Cellvibrio sp. KY-GH-1]|uniref:putative metalloprotease CJM1_0395 family protein n=1 Tax=Cellvibrio sp. KY-GH-1 TaxID=2303332 RepID=UPI00124519C6|nr:putative metalloprotease CJM1_0395 family protein [Cellvibrio sp. KY-GH-1]QEY16907.1 catalase [Cellvibrio sp. KY-GH-1]